MLTLALAGHTLELSDHAAHLDGRDLTLAAGAHALLRRLALDPGRVVTRAELAVILPSAGRAQEHAVEAAVSRLRVALGDPRIVQTVVKRGYRLALDA